MPSTVDGLNFTFNDAIIPLLFFQSYISNVCDAAVRVVAYGVEAYGFTSEAEKQKPLWDTVHNEVEGVTTFYPAGEGVSLDAAVNRKPRVREGDA